MSTQNNQDQSLEKSVRYISGYLKFDLKKDLKEVTEPICKCLESIAEKVGDIIDRMDGIITIRSGQSYDQ